MTVKVSEERFKKGESMGLFEALALAQGEFDQVVFDKRSHYGGYATVSAIRKATQPSLSKFGLAVIQPWEGQANGDIIIQTRILHKSGEQIVSSSLIVKGNKNDQQLGSSITYTRRYQLASILGIYAEEDDDAEESKKEHDLRMLDEEKARIKSKQAEKQPITLLPTLGELNKPKFMDDRKLGEIQFFLDYLPKETLEKLLIQAKISSLSDLNELQYKAAIIALSKELENLTVCKK